MSKKEKIRRPLSNFTFTVESKVIGSHSSSTGYLVKVTPETIDVQQNSDSDDSDSDTSSHSDTSSQSGIISR